MPRRDEYDDDRDYRRDDDERRGDDDDRPQRRRDDDDHEDYDDYERGGEEREDYERRPRRRHERAAKTVALPGLFMIILGVLGLVFAVFRTITDQMFANDPNAMGPFGNANNDPQMKKFQDAMLILGPILNVIWSLIVLFGGIQMRKLKSHGFVLFSCIWAMLPCSLCCALGIPLGIWGLVAIFNADVKRVMTT